MIFEKGQTIYIIYRVKARKRNRHNWKVEQGIILNDNGTDSRVRIKVNENYQTRIKRRCVFSNLQSAESKCEYWNHWGKYHKNIDYRGKRKHR